jgi:hypothetical protein
VDQTLLGIFSSRDFVDENLFKNGRSLIPRRWNLYGIDVTNIIKRLALGLCNGFSSLDIKANIAIGDSVIKGIEVDSNLNLTVLCYPGADIHDAFHVLRSILPSPFVGIVLLHIGSCNLSTKDRGVVAPTKNGSSKFQKQIQRNVGLFLNGVEASKGILKYTTRFGFLSLSERFHPIRFFNGSERAIDKRYSNDVARYNEMYKRLAKKHDFVFLKNVRTITGPMMANDGLHLNPTGVKHLSNVFEKAQTEIASYDPDEGNGSMSRIF